jgi:hypothetical protein
MERLNKLAAFQRKGLQGAFLCELVHLFSLNILLLCIFLDCLWMLRSYVHNLLIHGNSVFL